MTGVQTCALPIYGVPDVFSEQGTRAEQLETHDLHAAGLRRAALDFLASLDASGTV